MTQSPCNTCTSFFSLSLRKVSLLFLDLLLIINQIRSSSDFTSLENDYISDFRIMVDGLLTKEFMKSDGYLLRWLQVYDFDLEQTYEKFKKSLEWREEHNIDNILQENFTIIDEAYPYTIDGVDNDGRPIAWAPIGTYDVRKITISGEQELYQRYMMRMFELIETYLHQIRLSTGKDNITQIIVIFDMGGFNVKQGACLRCLGMIPEFMSNVEQNYPNIFYKAYHINTPSLFQSVFRIAKNFMSGRTQEALQIFDYNKDKWSAALLKQIPKDQLPLQYGGSKQMDFMSSAHSRNDIIEKIVENANIHEDNDHSELIQQNNKLGLHEDSTQFRNHNHIQKSSQIKAEVIETDAGSGAAKGIRSSGVIEIEIEVPLTMIMGDNALSSPSSSGSDEPDQHSIRHHNNKHHHHHHHYKFPTENSDSLPQADVASDAVSASSSSPPSPPSRKSYRREHNPHHLRNSGISLQIPTSSFSSFSKYSLLLTTVLFYLTIN